MARIAMVGMGNRGSVYGRHARTLGGEVVAVAEPRSRLRDRLSDLWGVPEAGRFADWQQLVEAEPAVDLVFIATQDQLHRDPAVAFLEAGYDVVLEKPMAPTEEDSRAILDAASRSGPHLVVAHVLRYQPYSRMVMRLISEGAIGSVTHLDHFERIGDQHFAHSYVRGNWRREEEASSALMSKSCHDLDWICAVVGSQATSVASFGSLSHFKEANAPEGAGHRCLHCAVEADCAFSARRFYMAALESESGWDWPLSVVAEEPTQAAVTEALRPARMGVVSTAATTT